MSRKLAAKMASESGLVMASRANGTAAEAIESGAGEEHGASHRSGARMFGASSQEAQHGDDQEGRRDHGEPARAGSRHSIHQVTDADDVDAERSWTDAPRGHGGVELPIGEYVRGAPRNRCEPWAARPGR